MQIEEKLALFLSEDIGKLILMSSAKVKYTSSAK